MEIHATLPNRKVLAQSALTVGTFDGVHRGHQLLIGELKRIAAEHSLTTAALTFQDMPHCYFKPDDCPRLLTLAQEKIEVFKQLQIDHLFIVPFDAAIASTTYDVFTREVLQRQIGMKVLLVGPDFALGRGRMGTVDALRALGRNSGFEVKVLDAKLKDDDLSISSTRVRGCVESGDLAGAARMLGHPFSFEGQTIAGKQLGRTIGVPTVNLKVHPRKVLPANGVYAARAVFPDGSTHFTALSIGTNPTTDADERVKVEFHVIDEVIETPPDRARLEIAARLRDEAKFDSLDELVAQMQRDVAQARELLA